MQRRPQPNPYTKVFALIGLVLLIAGLLIMVGFSQIRLAALAVMAAGVILLIAALVVDFRHVKAALTGRRGRLGTGTTLMGMIFLGIIVLANGVVLFASQDPKILAATRFDVTKLAQFTLTQQTKDVLTKLDKPVKAFCFFVPSKDLVGTTFYATSLLGEYQKYTENLSLEVVDPDERPDLAREYGISFDTQYQAVVFEAEGRRKIVTQREIVTVDDNGTPVGVEGEHSFTSAILEVTGVAQKKVYFLTGHGEKDIEGNYGSVLNGLRDVTYVVETVNLITFPTVPADTAVLVIASPRSPLTDQEIDAINKYLIDGGQCLILADPGFPENLDQLVSPWGVNLIDGTIIDPLSSVAPRQDMPLVQPNRNYFSTTLGVPLYSYFPGAVGVKEQEESPLLKYPLVWTSGISWLEKDFSPEIAPQFDEDKDDPGPVAIGVVIASQQTETQNKLTRIIIVGDSDFASNEHYAQVNNGDLFVNSINWLAEETELIRVHRAAQPFRRLAVNADQARFITYSSLALPSVLVLLIGAVVWWYRS